MITNQSKIKPGYHFHTEFLLILWLLMMLSFSLWGQHPAAMIKDCSFSGILQSDWGDMTLVQEGNFVKGSYTYDEGRITGSVVQNKLVGTWAKAPSYSIPGDAGQIEMEFFPGCDELKVRWKYGHTGNWIHNLGVKWIHRPQSSTTAKDIGIWVDKEDFAPGEEIVVHFRTDNRYDVDAWVGIVPASIPNGVESVNEAYATAFKYLFDNQEGKIILIAPPAEGDYQIRLHTSDQNGYETDHVTIYVTANPVLKDVILPM